MSRLIFCTLAAAIALLSSIAASPGQSADDEQLAVYAAIAGDYRKAAAGAAGRLLGLGADRLKTLDGLMEEAIRRPALFKADTPWTPVLFRAAAMLRTEVAFGAHDRHDRATFKRHIDAADDLLQLAFQREPDNDFRARWHVAAGLRLLSAGDISEADDFAGRHCRTAAPPPKLRLLCGVTASTHAMLIRFPLPLDSEGAPVRRPRSEIESERTRLVVARLDLLEQAVRHFEAAIAADRSLHEASLRAAHALMQMGKAAEAERHVAPLIDVSGAPPLRYLARLMLGALHERQGNRESAETLYRAASQLLPEAPRARVALAHLLYNAGDRVSAPKIIAALVEPALDPADDPWTFFPVDFIATPYATLDDLLREVRR